MSKLTAKEKILAALTKKTGYNTFTVAQAQRRFGIKNVAARIHELRNEGYSIYSNPRTTADGSKVVEYRLGKPSKAFKQYAKSKGIKVQTVA